jgi:hypothetical protein
LSNKSASTFCPHGVAAEAVLDSVSATRALARTARNAETTRAGACLDFECGVTSRTGSPDEGRLENESPGFR